MFRRCLSFLAALICAFAFSSSALAQTTRIEYRAKNNVYPAIMSGFHQTKASAAAEMISLVNAYLPSIDVQCVNLTKNGVRKRNAAINGWTGADPASWDVGQSVMPHQTCSTWNAETRFGGYTFQWEQRTVEVPQCSDGQTSQHTFFSGWSTDQNGTNMVGGDVPGPSSYCDGQCLSDRTSLVSCNSDGELSPNGYYSGTCTWSYTSNGQTCNTPTQDPGPTPEPPPQNPGDGDPGDGDGDPGDGDGGGDPGDGDGDGDGGSGDPDGDPNCGGEGQAACDGGGGSSTGGGTACTQEQIAAGLCSCTTPEGQPSQCGTGGGNTGGGNTGGSGDGEDDSFICDMFPNSFMCQPMGSAGSAQPVEDLGNLGRTEVNPRAGFGPSNSQCPAPQTVYIQLLKRTVVLPWDAVCQWADTVRPIVIALGWLSAMLGVIGFVRR